MESSGKEVSRWADAHMFRAAPMSGETRTKGVPGIRPVVTLINAMPDPLGSLASIVEVYKGGGIHLLSEMDDDRRRTAFAEMMKTVLSGPLEVGYFHFGIEGVPRSWTHQAVRSRFSFFAQESLRFAVPEEDWALRTYVPPSIANDKLGAMDVWDAAMVIAQESYESLVNHGIPAEDARGLIPHAMTTRLHWVCDLRTLLGEAGKRLCTQAEFPWRLVFAGVAKALREYSTAGNHNWDTERDGWQFDLIADALRPICYAENACKFMAQFDRSCSIRGRVNDNAAAGRPSSEWGEPVLFRLPRDGSENEVIGAIRTEEWLLDPGAARG